MPLGPPVGIDPVTLGAQQGGSVPFGASMVSGPWSFGGALYIVLGQSLHGGSQPVDMWKSTDNGATWTVLDHAHAISAFGFQVCFDGAHTVTVVSTASAGPPLAMSWIQFDLSTGLWGAAVGGGPVGSPQLVLPRPDGSQIAVYQSTNAAPFSGVLLYAVSFLAGWGAPFQFDTNIDTLLGATYAGPGSVFGCVDSTGTAHVFVEAFATVFAVPSYYYQPLSSGNALGALHTFAGISASLTGGCIGLPCVQGSSLVFPYWADSGGGVEMSAFIGTPLAAPVWTAQVGIDPVGGVNLDPNFRSPSASTDGTTVSLVYVMPTLDAVYTTGIIRLCKSTTLAAWTCSQAFDIETDAPASYQLAGGQLQVSPLFAVGGISLVAIDPTHTQFQGFWLAGAAASVPQSVVITLYGWKLYPESPCAELEQVAEAPRVKRAV